MRQCWRWWRLPAFLLNRAAQREAWFRQESLRVAWEKFSRGVRFMGFEPTGSSDTLSHAAEDYETSRQTANVGNLRDISLDIYRFDARQQVLQGFLLITCTLAALLAGGWMVATGHATRGQVMVFYAAAGVFAVQTRAIVDSIPPIRRGLNAFDQLISLMRTTEREPYQGTGVVDAIEHIRLDDISFTYRVGVPLITGVSFEIRRGEQLALIGANGSGKSTIAHLIVPGVYRPESGGVFVNGISYDEAGIFAASAIAHGDSSRRTRFSFLALSARISRTAWLPVAMKMSGRRSNGPARLRS